MYFATYKYKEEENYGILNHEKNAVIPMELLLNKLNEKAPENLRAFVEEADDLLIQTLHDVLNKHIFKSIPISDVKLCAPIPYPNRNLMCLGKNYLEHVKEVKEFSATTNDLPEYPIYFNKTAYPAIGDQDVIKSHSMLTDEIDYEVELAVIIGKEGKNIDANNIEAHIFGYTIVNDISARDIQSRHEQWFKGKSLETFCPMGPYLVHKSAVLNPNDLELTCSVNGELRQCSNTKHMIFDIPYIISDLSKGMTLRAGDIILTGTPSGVGLGFNPPQYLKSGDTVVCHIDKIGYLTNTIK